VSGLPPVSFGGFPGFGGTGGFGGLQFSGSGFGASPGGGINFGGLATGLGSAIGGLGSFIQGQDVAQADQAEAQGFTEAAQQYQLAAQIAQENVRITGQIGKIQEYQLGQQIQRTTESGYAAEGSSGFLAGSGSGYYIARSNILQGGITKGALTAQTALQQEGYEEQKVADIAQKDQATAAAAAAQAQASAASSSGIFGLLGGIAQGIGSIFNI
jgi:hypothetical protein